MRHLINITLPNKEFNDAVRDGSAGTKLKKILDDLKPEAVYFTSQQGQRGLVMIIDVAEPSSIPSIAEPWFLLFNATLEIKIVMEPQELAKASLDELGRKWA